MQLDETVKLSVRSELIYSAFCFKLMLIMSPFLKNTCCIIRSPPTMWWWRLIVFAESACSRRHLFLLSLGKPYSDYFQIFAVCILALGYLPGKFFFAFFSFFNKIQDGRQNPMAHATAWTASSICFMFGLKERPYPGRELKSFWCDSDNKNFAFFTF